MNTLIKKISTVVLTLTIFVSIMPLRLANAAGQGEAHLYGLSPSKTIDISMAWDREGNGSVLTVLSSGGFGLYGSDVTGGTDMPDIEKVIIKNAPTTFNGETFDYGPIRAIGGFFKMKNLKEVEGIPSSVEIISGTAFYKTNLSKISLPNNAIHIQSKAFYDTPIYNDSSNWKDGILYIGNHLIKADEAVSEKCNIKSGTVDIAEEAFLGCSSVSEIVVPDGVSIIGGVAFSNCGALKKVYIPDSVTWIGRDILKGSPNAKIYASKDSFAIKCAIQNNLPYVIYPDDGDEGGNDDNITMPVQKPEKYNVSFNANGGSVSTSSKTVTNGETYGTLPTPSRSGFKFEGWYTSKSGGIEVKDNHNVELTSNLTLYAHWSLDEDAPKWNDTDTNDGPNWEKTETADNTSQTFTVKYDANGGSNAPSKQTKTNGENLKLSSKTPSRTGYVFRYWNTDKNGNGITYPSGSYYSQEQGVTLYAQWETKRLTITYDANGGKIKNTAGKYVSSTKMANVAYSYAYGTMPTPTRDGYEFIGWYTEKSGGELVDEDSDVEIPRDHTLYARWNESKIFYDIPSSAKYAEAVRELSAIGIISGYADGCFRPNDTITRAETAAIMVRFMGIPESKGSTVFSDTPYDHWAAGYINAAYKSGIINGMGNGNFEPSSDVKYEQVVKMLVVSLGSYYDQRAKNNGGYPNGYIYVANERGITTGVNGSVGQSSTRATVAMLVYNTLKIK